MIIPVFSDLHLHNYSEFSRVLDSGLNSRLVAGLGVLRTIRAHCVKEGLRHVLFGGDFVHKGSLLLTRLLQAAYEEIAAFKEAGVNVVMVVGNHDQATLDGATHALKAFSEIATVVDTPRTVTLPGPSRHMEDVTVRCVPYIEDSAEFKKALNGRADILLAHGAFNGAVTGPVEYQPEHPLDVSDITGKYGFTFLGHYHKKQKMADKCWYIGSPQQHSRGEALEREKGFLLYNTETRTFKNVPLLCPEFVEVEWRGLEDPPSKDAEIDGNYVDVEVGPQYDVTEAVQWLMDHGAEAVNPVPVIPQKVVKQRLDVNLSMGLDKLVKKYTDEYCPEDLDRQEVVKQAMKFLEDRT